MIPLRFRKKTLYLDRYEILNGQEDLNKAKISPVPSPVFASENDLILVVEDEKEFIVTLVESYCCFFRFYDSFRDPFSLYCWISRDSELSTFLKYVGKRTNLLGEWKYDDWVSLELEMRRTCDRTYVIQREWYNEARRLLVESGNMPEWLL